MKEKKKKKKKLSLLLLKIMFMNTKNLVLISLFRSLPIHTKRMFVSFVLYVEMKYIYKMQ